MNSAASAPITMALAPMMYRELFQIATLRDKVQRGYVERKIWAYERIAISAEAKMTGEEASICRACEYGTRYLRVQSTHVCHDEP